MQHIVNFTVDFYNKLNGVIRMYKKKFNSFEFIIDIVFNIMYIK